MNHQGPDINPHKKTEKVIVPRVIVRTVDIKPWASPRLDS